jgi:peroxiredoxin
MTHINPGKVIAHQTLQSIHGTTVDIPHPTRLTHLQFRRFAGCPVCNLHVHEFFNRHNDLVDHGIQEVVVFQSSNQVMSTRLADAPFPLISDPTKSLYKAFGVGTSITAMLNPKMLSATIKGVRRYGVKLPETVDAAFNLPADFLIDSSGSVLASNYGTHYDDQWDVDELIRLAESGISTRKKAGQ